MAMLMRRPFRACDESARSSHPGPAAPRPGASAAGEVETKVAMPSAMHSVRPSGCLTMAPPSFSPVAVIRPAATAPIRATRLRPVDRPRTGCIVPGRAPGSAGKSACRRWRRGRRRSAKWRWAIIIDKLITLGPGRICATAQSSTNSSRVIHCFFSTSSRWTPRAPRPCKARKVKEKNRSKAKPAASEPRCGHRRLGRGHHGGDYRILRQPDRIKVPSTSLPGCQPESGHGQGQRRRSRLAQDTSPAARPSPD